MSAVVLFSILASVTGAMVLFIFAFALMHGGYFEPAPGSAHGSGSGHVSTSGQGSSAAHGSSSGHGSSSPHAPVHPPPPAASNNPPLFPVGAIDSLMEILRNKAQVVPRDGEFPSSIGTPIQLSKNSLQELGQRTEELRRMGILLDSSDDSPNVLVDMVELQDRISLRHDDQTT